MANPGNLPSLDDYNGWEDFWRYSIGVNIIPADTKKKAIYIKWSQWQDKPIPEELHNKWKDQNMFSNGMAVILGKVWHNKQKSGLYLNGIDADNLKAVQEICSRNGKTFTLQELAEWTLVEQHPDDTNRVHVYIYSQHKPFAKKSSDKTTIESIKKIESNEIPAIEVKGEGRHGTLFCSPSIHKNGHGYQILGAYIPRIADDFEQHIHNICKKYGISYLDGNGKAKSSSPLVPIEDLFKPDTKIYKGHNRHEALLRTMESLIVRNRSILSMYKIQELAREWNNTHCEPPLDDHEFDRQWNDANRFIDRKNRQEQEQKGWQGSGRIIIVPTGDKVQDEDEQLAAENKLTAEGIEFVINTIKKEAQYDELSIRQLLCGMSSAFTKVPISHIVNSKESGAGKSYLLNLVSSYFPNKYVIALSGMSAKALFHRRGSLVIQNKQTGDLEPIAPMIEPKQAEIDDIENKLTDESNKEPKHRDKKQIKNWKKRVKELELEIKDIESRAEKLIQLDNQIILCLDTPEPSVYDALMSIISQDTERDQQYSFVDKLGTSGKLGTKDNILRGTPVLFTSQVIDDTKTLRFAEKNRRFINVNPDTSSQKIRAANNIIGLKHGFLPEEYDQLVVSRSDKERASSIVNIMIAKLKQHTKKLGPKEDGVKIPFALSITSSIPDGYVWSMTITDRTIKYLSIITKMNMDARPKLVNEQTGQFYPIATFEDLKETLKLMQVGASGARPYIVNWYNKVFVFAIKDLDGRPNQQVTADEKTIDGTPNVIASEKHVGVNTEQLAAKTKDVFKCTKPSNKELRDKYLEPLVNLGVIDKVRSEIDKRENIYLPVEEGDLFHIFDDSANNDSNLRLTVLNPEAFPNKNFLKEQFRISLEKNADGKAVLEKNFCHYKLVDTDGTEITLDQLLDRYFNNSQDCFIKAYEEEASNNDKECNGSTTEIMLKATVTSNILYQQQIIQKQKK